MTIDNGDVMMRGRWWWVVATVSVALLLAGLAWFLADQHLDRADKWASVVGMFVGIAGLLLSGYSLVQTRRSAHPSTPPAADSGPDGSVTNTITGGQFHGPVITGRDMTDVVLPPTPPAVPPGAAPQPGEGTGR